MNESGDPRLLEAASSPPPPLVSVAAYAEVPTDEVKLVVRTDRGGLITLQEALVARLSLVRLPNKSTALSSAAKSEDVDGSSTSGELASLK